MDFFQYSLPAIRATQAGAAFYAAMCPVELLATLLPEGMSDGVRELPSLNKERVAEIGKYIFENRTSYVVTAITVSINVEPAFATAFPNEAVIAAGELRIPLAAKLQVLDGMHRCAALRQALSRDPTLQSEAVPIVLIVDVDFAHSEKIFADLKRHGRRPAASLSILHDRRDILAALTRDMINRIPNLSESVEVSRSTISNRSRKLFTLSGLYHANKILLADLKNEAFEDRLKTATDFWLEVAKNIPEWGQAFRGEISAAEMRRTRVHAHALALAALARAGRSLIRQYPKQWKRKLKALSQVDWSRSNSKTWEGRAMIGGRLSKSTTCVTLTGNVIKKHLGLELTPEEQRVEQECKKRR